MVNSQRVALAFAYYLGYVVAFACVYSLFFHGQFRFDGVRYEQAYKDRMRELELSIAQEINSRPQYFEGILLETNTAFEHQQRFDYVEAHISIPDTERDALVMIASLRVYERKSLDEYRKCKDKTPGFGECLYFELFMPRAHLLSECLYAPRLEDLENQEDTFYCRELTMLDHRGEQIALFKSDLRVEIPDPLLEAIYNFIHAPTHLDEGLFERMFYLSAITATTLGYGDVIPITTAARIAVSFQTIFGLFLMGAFIAWVTGKRS